MLTRDFYFALPEDLIAQKPLPSRSSSRMMVLNRGDFSIKHSCVSNLPEFLDPGDLLVFNNTKVIPARLIGHRANTNGKVELLLIEETSSNEWICMYKASGKPEAGIEMEFAHGLRARVEAVGDQGRPIIKFFSKKPLLEILDDVGVTPLPPYIKRTKEEIIQQDGSMDRSRYQTIFAKEPGSVAAPTAGLHFDESLFAALEKKGLLFTEITLHVGPGTFKPVKSETVEDHKIESERFMVSASAAQAVSETLRKHRKVVAVGSTSVRVLEYMANKDGTVRAGEGRTDIFIYPPYDFKAVSAIFTNFHLPCSTLLMMVCAFGGKEFVMKAYQEAVKERYRFYSYGDCMLIL